MHADDSYYLHAINVTLLTPCSSGLGKGTVGNSGSGSFWQITGLKGCRPNCSKPSATHLEPTPCIAAENVTDMKCGKVQNDELHSGSDGSENYGELEY